MAIGDPDVGDLTDRVVRALRRRMFVCDTGGVLNRVVHFYHYRDFDHRDSVRQAVAADKAWQEQYLDNSRRTLSMQVSTLLTLSCIHCA